MATTNFIRKHNVQKMCEKIRKKMKKNTSVSENFATNENSYIAKYTCLNISLVYNSHST